MNKEKDFITPDDSNYYPLLGCTMMILTFIAAIFFIVSLISALWKYT